MDLVPNIDHGKLCFVYCGDELCNCGASEKVNYLKYVLPKLNMLIGVPGSGKSTYVEKLINVDPYALVVSSDRYIELKAQDEGKTYSEVFTKHMKGAEAFMKTTLNIAISETRDIIWDQTNLTIKSRARKLEQVPKNYKKIATVFPTPNEEELARRLASRPGKTIPEGIMEAMMDSFELPLNSEGFDEIIYLEKTWKPL